MHISRIQIENFRNFYEFDVTLGHDAVIVGENSVGKSNLVHALRLLLDPALPDSFRQLRPEDFWDGISRPVDTSERISISVELRDFEQNQNQLASLADHLVTTNPMVARLTFEFASIDDTRGKSSWTYRIYGGGRRDNSVGYDVRRRLALEFIPALRDAESDLANWKRSPLRPMITKAADSIPETRKKRLAARMQKAANKILNLRRIAGLQSTVSERLTTLAGSSQAKAITLGLGTEDFDRTIRGLRLMVDNGLRSVGEASLGLANTIYLSLRLLELEALATDGVRDHTFLTIEEPEAHLHPQLQRTVFRGLLNPKRHVSRRRAASSARASIILTTHSPHIASVAPIRSIVVMRETEDGTRGYAASSTNLSVREIRDLERYLDVTRAEILFARRVLLVEGDAEVFILPRLASMLGFDLDELGITVCSVCGTNFTPYVKLLLALGTPFAVITDKDPRPGKYALGDRRAEKLRTTIAAAKAPLSKAAVFLGNSTLETDLAASGLRPSLAKTLNQLATTKRDRELANSLLTRAPVGEKENKALIRAIERIGKGRFSQRLATNISKRTSGAYPNYIEQALRHISKSKPQ